MKLTRQMRETARLLAGGMSPADVARQIRRTEETVLEWMHDPGVMRLFQDRVLQKQVVSYARAVERIGAMLEDDSPAVVQRAAHEALEQFESAALRMNGQEVRVRLEGAPEIGMPGTDDGDG